MTDRTPVYLWEGHLEMAVVTPTSVVVMQSPEGLRVARSHAHQLCASAAAARQIPGGEVRAFDSGRQSAPKHRLAVESGAGSVMPGRVA